MLRLAISLLFIVLPNALSIGFGSTIVGPGAVQLIATATKAVVAIGEPSILEVQLYAVVESQADVALLQSAFEEGRFRELPGVELIRKERLRADMSQGPDGSMVARLSGRFVFRVLAEGGTHVALDTVVFRDRVYGSNVQSVYAYRPTPELHAAARSIVPISVERTDPVTRRKITRTGSAFFIDGGALVTSYHVVSDARRVHVLLPDGRRITTDKVWSVDPIRDVAVLYVDPKLLQGSDIKPLALYNASGEAYMDADAGRAVFTNGWPGGVRRSTAGLAFDDVRLGYDRVWVSSNSVGPGDSGGPLMNRRGEVVGVVTLGTMVDSNPDILREDVCIVHDPRPAIGMMNTSLGPQSLKSVFEENGFRRRPYVQAFRVLAMIMARERFDESLRGQLEALDGSLRMRNADPGLHFMRGVLYRMLGTRDEAHNSFAEVLRLYDTYFPASYILGMDRLREGRVEEAAAYLERTMASEPYRDLARYGFARTLMKRHRYDEAATLLEEVALHDPDYAPGLYQLALCRLALGDEDALAIAFVRLGRASRLWQNELRQVLLHEVLRPRVLVEMPRAVLPQARKRH